MTTPAKNTICLWYDRDAEDAARFYAATFPNSSVGAVHCAPGDFPSGKKGDVLTVEFTVIGICNGQVNLDSPLGRFQKLLFILVG
jgi:2-polyprenyl-6-hydroxyphenyl methylase/3-demethylubiquinone-9 3-methyltransferase